jgi:hypothetical protein
MNEMDEMAMLKRKQRVGNSSTGFPCGRGEVFRIGGFRHLAITALRRGLVAVPCRSTQA